MNIEQTFLPAISHGKILRPLQWFHIQSIRNPGKKSSIPGSPISRQGSRPGAKSADAKVEGDKISYCVLIKSAENLKTIRIRELSRNLSGNLRRDHSRFYRLWSRGWRLMPEFEALADTGIDSRFILLLTTWISSPKNIFSEINRIQFLYSVYFHRSSLLAIEIWDSVWDREWNYEDHFGSKVFLFIERELCKLSYLLILLPLFLHSKFSFQILISRFWMNY